MLTRQWDQSLAGNGAIITHCLRTGEWREVSISLVGVSLALEGMNRTAKMNQFVLLNLEIGGLALGVEDLFLRRQDAFTVLTWFGRFAAADEIWRVLDPMGRDWGLAFYRPGMAEAKYARFKLAQGVLTNEYLSEVERIASHGKHLPTIREVKGLRGEWCLEQREW